LLIIWGDKEQRGIIPQQKEFKDELCNKDKKEVTKKAP
jgi:hypothetical protein